MNDHWAATIEKISHRLKLGTQRPDFISPIMKYNEEGKGLTLGEIQSNTPLFNVAASDSIATVFTGTTFYLLQNSQVYEKTDERDLHTSKKKRRLMLRVVPRFPYMRACLNETNRRHPPFLTG